MIPLDGPYYEDLSVGQVLPRQPSVVIDEGMAALYQSMVGERLPMVMDPAVSAAVTGQPGRLASPGLVLHLSIGHSTTLTRRTIANLFYRDLRLLRPVFVGQSPPWPPPSPSSPCPTADPVPDAPTGARRWWTS